MFHTYVILLVGAVCLPIASGSVYPTQPTQAKVWTADRPETVSWIEDWKYPTLDEMGPFDLSLWCNTNTYLVQLASGVDPMTKTCAVTVPARVLCAGVKYTLRFATSKPVDTVIYSADFVIVQGNASAGSVTTNSRTSMTVSMVESSIVSATQNGTESGFRTVVTTQSGGSSSFSLTSSTTPSGTPPPLGSIPGGQGQRAPSAARRDVDMEKLKFRFVFVFWPVLVGISMAL